MHLSRVSRGLVALAILLWLLMVYVMSGLPGLKGDGFLLVLVLGWALAAANASGLAALVISFTKYRRNGIAFTLIAASLDLGLALCFLMSGSRFGNLTWELELFCWPAVLLGIIAFVRWAQPKTIHG